MKGLDGIQHKDQPVQESIKITGVVGDARRVPRSRRVMSTVEEGSH